MKLEEKMAAASTPKPKLKPKQQQQPQSPQSGKHQPPNQEKKKLPMTAIAIVAAIVLAIVFAVTVVPLLIGSGSKTVTPESPMVQYVPADGVDPVDVDVKQLLDDVEVLKQQAEASPNNGGSESSQLYLPEGVTSIADFDRDEADFLKPSSLRKVQEPIPYKKGYKEISSNQYAFFLTIDYGGATLSIPVHYSDYKELKPNGVTYFIVEYAEVRPDPDASYQGVVTGIVLDPYWQENMQPQKQAN